MKSQATVLFVASISIAASASLAVADVIDAALSDAHSATAPADAARSQWNRTAALIRQSADLQAIIKLHQNFLAKYPDAPLARDVGESLANYQKLADAEGVKYHGVWMTADQLDAVMVESAAVARPVLRAYLAGKIKEALDGATAILAKDPQDANALTIGGLAAYRSGNVALARKYFGAISDADPGYVLAQNNLAVIGYQQKQTGEVLLHYSKALGALGAPPADLLLLDNVAEAIHTYQLAGANVATLNFRALADAYAKAESATETEMAKSGLRRLGSAWVTQEQFDALAKNRQAMGDQMKLLDAQYQATNAAIANMDAAIQQVNTQSANPNLSYADFSRLNWQKGLLQGQHDVLISRLSDLSAQGETLKSQLAAADNPFTGEQVIMDIVAAASPSSPIDASAPPLAPPAIALAPPVTPSILPGASAPVAQSTISTDDSQPPPPPTYGGSYNPPSLLVNVAAASPKPSATPPHVDHCVPRRSLFVNSKSVDLAKLGPPGTKIPAHGNLLYTPEGVIALDDANVDFSGENGAWYIGQNGSVVYHNSTVPITPPIAPPSGPWTLNAKTATRFRQSTIPLRRAPWVLDSHGQAVRQSN